MIIYSREKKELIIPTGFASDSCAEAVEEARQTGYTEGEEAQKAKLTSVKLTENGTYTREDGWNEVEVDVDGTTCDLEAEKHIDVDPTTFSGEEVYYPSDNKDGMASVRVTGMSAQQYRTNMQNNWIEAAGGVAAGVTNGAQGLVITQNGTYTATGRGTYSNQYLGVSQDYPILYNEVTVNVSMGVPIYARWRLTFSQDTVIPPTQQGQNRYYYYNTDYAYYTFDLTETSGGEAIRKTLEDVIHNEIVVLQGVWIMDVLLYHNGVPNVPVQADGGQIYLTSLTGTEFPNCTAEFVGFYNNHIRSN